MKGRMNVLNFKKEMPSKSQMKSYRKESNSCPYTVIKMEPDDEREKENCGDDVCDCSDLVIDTNREMLDEEEAEIGEEDVIADLPVLSVIIKEEDGVLEYNDDEVIPKPLRPDVEIKYEDDIEEEDYDSEDSESIGPVEMSEFSLRDYEKSNSTSSNTQMQAQRIRRNQTENSTASCINPYLESSILNFQMGSHFGEKFASNGTAGHGDPFNREKSSDSVLLSIVYATINVPFSQVSKFLTAYNLSKSQLSVIRKVRRQVKNRLYAQNCRRRRVAHIKNLANELIQLKNEKEKLCSVRDELTARKKMLETHYKQLYDHVINVLRERHKQSAFQPTTEADEDFSDEEEMLETRTEKLIEERRAMEETKRKLEGEYQGLYEHVFKVISTRNHTNGMARNGIDNSLDFQLCNMNIVNELAMLNQYWTKNNSMAGETMDFESSCSVDGSRTSESKLNDFVDYESSGSVDGSRTEENTMNDDLIDYDSGSEEATGATPRNPDSMALMTAADSAADHIEDIPVVEESSGRVSEESAMAWSDNTDDEDSDNEDCMDKEELELLKLDLEDRKQKLELLYEKLYDHVLKASEMNETEFLKAFMDHCIKLLKAPKRDPCSIGLDVS